MRSLLCIIVAFILSSCSSRNNKRGVNVLGEDIADSRVISTDIDSLRNNMSNYDENNRELSEFVIIDEDFRHALDSSINTYTKCKNIKKGYHFTISVNDVKNQQHPGMKSLYISESYYKDFISGGYGFVYYKNYLFILRRQQLVEIFKETNNTKSFSYKEEPVTIFDPPRWLYYYWNKEFYLANSSPCGG